MAPLAEVFRAGAEEYLRIHGERVPSAHLRAMSDIMKCRSPQMDHGGVYVCECGMTHYSYHSCGNRNCPKCGNDKATKWLDKRLAERLPVEHFLVTFSLPSELRGLSRQRPETVFDAFFRASSAALSELALDRRFLGGKVGMAGFLQTWRRDLGWHPHIHYIVPGGGISRDGKKWVYPRTKGFLVHGSPLAKIFRGKFRDEMDRAGLLGQIDPAVWRKDWIANCVGAGDGAGAYRYLAAYTQRTAITENRITGVSGGGVTYSWKESGSGRRRLSTVPVTAFIALFLQHVLPRGFVRTRYYGFMAPAAKCTLKRLLLMMIRSRSSPPQENACRARTTPLCPSCGRPMRLVETWRRPRGPPA